MGVKIADGRPQFSFDLVIRATFFTWLQLEMLDLMTITFYWCFSPNVTQVATIGWKSPQPSLHLYTPSQM